MTMTVIVPTYRRPQYLKKCLTSIVKQTRQPDHICVVVRYGDEESLFAVKDFVISRSSSIPIELVMVEEAGFLPPVQAGIDAVQTDIVAFIDDDAEALPDWLERLERHYQATQVVGVGGREIKTLNGVEKGYKPARVFGKVFWYGRCEGNLYRDGFNDDVIEVDGLVGCNMSYRTSVLKAIKIDWVMGNGTSYQYELDLGLQIKKMGLKLLYDPTAKVKHFEAAARSGGAEQIMSNEQAYWMSFNTEYVVFKHAGFLKRFVALFYNIFIGQSLRWGVLSLAWYYFRFHQTPQVFRSSLAGRIAGIRTALFQKPVYLNSSSVGVPCDFSNDPAYFSSAKAASLPLVVTPQ